MKGGAAVKINEVEASVGITKKNIRFYEQEGLLCPRRNSENGYREYSQEEVDALMRIKLLRKLGLPLEEIRRLQAGEQTVGDAMRRHLVALEREQSNLEQAMALCRELQQAPERLDQLDAAGVLDRMEHMEQSGARFQNKQQQDVRRYAAPVAVTVGMVALMLALTALGVWGYQTEAPKAPPPALMAVFLLIPLTVIVGVILALKQRWRELRRGEEDEAKQY